MAIVLDAMGGDHAPQAIVAGAVQATRSSNFPIILVGRHDVLEAELREARYRRFAALHPARGGCYRYARPCHRRAPTSGSLPFASPATW